MQEKYSHDAKVEKSSQVHWQETVDNTFQYKEETSVHIPDSLY
jgi:hypothetical protein